MNFSQLKEEAYRMSGNVSYLNPATDVSYGGVPYLNWVVNEAIRQLSGWVDPQTSTVYRFPFLKSSLLFKSVSYTDELTEDSSDNTISFVGTDVVGGANDQYNDWIVECNGETFLIYDYDNATQVAIIAGEWSTVPVIGDTFKLYKRFSFIAPSTFDWVAEHILIPDNIDTVVANGNFSEVLTIKDITNKTDLSKANQADGFTSSITDSGTPSVWYRFGNKLVFDKAPDSEIWYEMEFYRYPSELVNDTDVPELPVDYHYGIILWIRHWIYMRLQDFSAAYAAKRDLIDFMRSKMTMADASRERNDSFGKLKLS
jgi:hypothetical protein